MPLRRALAALTSTSLVAALVPVLAGALFAPAQADSAPAAPAPVLPATVSADALPTLQIDGVAWTQLVVGSTVYVGGAFTSTRPSGSPAGTNETPRVNLLAYDITTGKLIKSFAPPALNGDVLALAASADGSTLYVGGSFDKVGTDFTTTSGYKWRSRAAAFSTSTGALVSGFAPKFGTTVRALGLVGSTLYAGGEFNAVNGVARKKLAAVDATTGATLDWAPEADASVTALLPALGGKEIVVGGHFGTLNGTTMKGSGALDPTTGANLPWAAQATAYSYGVGGAIASLSTDGDKVYATSYSYLNSIADLENTFAAEADGGTLVWLNPCLGDTYSSYPLNGVLYTSNHAHDCSATGGIPEMSPRSYQWALAVTTAPSGVSNGRNAYGWAEGTPGTNLLHWTPTFTSGKATGENQASWSVTGNDTYVVYGGEFGTVNGKAQQGLTRFAVRSAAPNKQGPQGGADLTPSATSTYPGQMRVSWRSAWDRDDATLTYELLRGSGADAVVVAQTTASSEWWNRPPLALDDPAPGSGPQTYQVRVTDPSGNTVTGPATTATGLGPTATASTYAQAVKADGATDYWRLGDSGGLVGTASIGTHDLTVDATETRGVDGALPDGDKAMTFTGTTKVPYSTRFGSAYRAVIPAATTYSLDGPQTYTTEAWFNTTTKAGGKIIGFGDSNRDTSRNYDRQVYMTDDGKLVAGVYSGGATKTATSPASYNDGAWHQVVASLGTSGLRLFVDGALVASDANTTQAQPFNGYWRIGGDNLNAWPSRPTSDGFAGTIDDVSVYPVQLTRPQVRAHYVASGRTAAGSTAPTDAYGAAVFTSDPQSYWRLQETSGTALADSSLDGTAKGTVNGTVKLGATGAPAVPGSTGASSAGDSGAGLASATSQAGTAKYSVELWFSTKSTRGGKLVGFGDRQSGNSGSYDRHVWLNPDGTMHFGVWTGSVSAVDTTKAYNDGAWHHVVATQGPSGMALYVDGGPVGTNAKTSAQAYTGYWRVGGDNLSGWASTSNGYLDASFDEVAVYSRPLTPAEVAAHYKASGGNLPPTISFTAVGGALSASVDASGSKDADGSIASYAWSFGEQGSGTNTATGATASHTYAAAGTYTVTLTVTDDKGATSTSSQQVVVYATRPAAPSDGYGRSVYADDPDAWYRMDGVVSTVTSARNSSRAEDTGVVRGAVTTGAVGIPGNPSGFAASLDGAVGTSVYDPRQYTGPSAYSVELWFSTKTTAGGKLVGFGDSAAGGTSARYDRHVWMGTDGTLHFGVNPGQLTTINTTTAYNDGKFHHVVATQGPSGMVLYVDGVSVGTNAQSKAEAFSGYWRFGGDNTSGWGTTTNGFFAGTLDEMAVYSAVLSSAAVADHYAKGAPTNTAPVASITAGTKDLTASVDASASKDADGSIASYTWDFGDQGSATNTATGATASHTYAAAGTYAVTLTVTDDKGLKGTSTTRVTVSAPVNRAPVAAFTSTVADLSASFDASGSTDADGRVVSYAWDFGDGTTGTGASAKHAYASAGARTVTLTVTDDKGAAGQVSHDVALTAPVPVNQAPTASFTSSSAGLVVSLDGSASADSDGSVASYAWDFGDQSAAGTGVRASHTYAAAGAYQVTLTVTDDKGSAATRTAAVTVVATTPPVTSAIAADAFGRTTASGWGSADTGGAWTVTGGAAGYSVSGGAGRMVMSKASTTSSASLRSVSAADVDITAAVSLDKAATGGAGYVNLQARQVGSSDYRLKTKVAAGGAVTLALVKVVGGTETSLRSTALPGVALAPGQVLQVRFSVVGSGTTTLSAKAWAAGTAEPTGWVVSTTDTTTSLQAAGAVGVLGYFLSTSADVAPVTASVSGYAVRQGA